MINARKNEVGYLTGRDYGGGGRTKTNRKVSAGPSRPWRGGNSLSAMANGPIVPASGNSHIPVVKGSKIVGEGPMDAVCPEWLSSIMLNTASDSAPIQRRIIHLDSFAGQIQSIIS